MVFSWPLISNAESEVRKIRIEVRNMEQIPMKGLRVKCRGHSEYSELSSESGLTDLLLPPGIVPGDSIKIELVPGTEFAREWVFLQPYNGSFNVPRPTQRYLEVIIIRREDFEALLTRRPVRRSEDTETNINVGKFDGLAAPLSKNR